MKAAVIAISLAALLPGGAASRPRDEITGSTAVAVAKWVAAVREHVPGRRDASLEHVASLTYQQRVELNPGMMLFLVVLQGRRVTPYNQAEKQIIALARGASSDATSFLKRAAVLHSDVAIPPWPRIRRHSSPRISSFPIAGSLRCWCGIACISTGMARSPGKWSRTGTGRSREASSI
jgi:hypothetical protein